MVGVLTLWTLAVTVPAIIHVWAPPATLGLDLDYDNVVRGAGSGPAAAGIAPGDRIDVRAVPLEERYAVPFGRHPRPGQRVTVHVVRNGQERAVTLAAERAPLSRADAVLLTLRILWSVVIVATGATLLFLRPSPMTWALFLYCLSPVVAGDGLPVYSFLPARVYLGLELANDLLIAATFAGVLAFALRFPYEEARGAWGAVQRFVRPLWVVFAAMIVYMDVAVKLLGAPAETVQRVGYVLLGATYAVSIWALVSTYRSATLTDRQRIKWVIMGVVLGRTATWVYVVLLSSSLVPGAPPSWLLAALDLCTVAGPLAIGYAVVRHRVIDVHFRQPGRGPRRPHRGPPGVLHVHRLAVRQEPRGVGRGRARSTWWRPWRSASRSSDWRRSWSGSSRGRSSARAVSPSSGLGRSRSRCRGANTRKT
ncbi:MAG TPA: hypothetical protein VEZ44_01550 [bacterium]|nr:hypothetical protein [bacterium]